MRSHSRFGNQAGNPRCPCKDTTDERTWKSRSERVSATTLPVPLSEISSVERSAAPLHLLIVDDDEHIREVCRTVAEECGMKGHDVSTAEEALEVMESFSIDILLTDLRLPGTVAWSC